MRACAFFPRDYGRLFACVIDAHIAQRAHMDGCPSGLRRRS